MNRFIQFALFVLLLAARPVAAQQAEFDTILAAIRQADKLVEDRKDRQAAAQYQLAQKSLIEFQKTNPKWETREVRARLSSLDERLQGWDGSRFPGSSAAPQLDGEELRERATYLERANTQYQYQLKQLHDENSRLSTKLREALAVRPVAQEPAVIARTQAQLERLQIDFAAAGDRVRALQKELSEYPELEEAKKNVQSLAETRKNLNQMIAEAEALRRSNEVLRKETATRPVATRDDSEELVKEILAAQTAQQLAETEVVRLRKENENLNIRLASLEARFSATGLAQTSSGAPQLNKIDSARLALSRGDSAAAAALLTAALKNSPENVELLHLMGRTLILQSKLDEAEVALKKALALSPDSGVTHFELARLYYSTDKDSPGLARWHYHKALNLGFPRNADFEKAIRWEQPGG